MLNPTLAAMAFTVTRLSWVTSPSTSWMMSSVMQYGVPDCALEIAAEPFRWA